MCASACRRKSSKPSAGPGAWTRGVKHGWKSVGQATAPPRLSRWKGRSTGRNTARDAAIAICSPSSTKTAAGAETGRRHHPGIRLHLLHRLLGTGSDEQNPESGPADSAFSKEDGGWPIYDGGPSNVSATVKAYFGLKLAGYSQDHPALGARPAHRAPGGVTAVNTFTKIYLCFFGQYDYRSVPAIPPEIVLFPNWFWFNIYEISSWSRAILVPLSIAYAKKPFKKIRRRWAFRSCFPAATCTTPTCA